MTNDYSGKPCGCGDFNFCVVCADDIEKKAIIADELKDMVSHLHPGVIELMSRDMSYTPEEIDRINVAGEQQDKLDAYAYAANSYAYETLGTLSNNGAEAWLADTAEPFAGWEYELIFLDAPQFRFGED